MDRRSVHLARRDEKGLTCSLQLRGSALTAQLYLAADRQFPLILVSMVGHFYRFEEFDEDDLLVLALYQPSGDTGQRQINVRQRPDEFREDDLVIHVQFLSVSGHSHLNRHGHTGQPSHCCIVGDTLQKGNSIIVI